MSDGFKESEGDAEGASERTTDGDKDGVTDEAADGEEVLDGAVEG